MSVEKDVVADVEKKLILEDDEVEGSGGKSPSFSILFRKY